ncbi:MAG: hypothetical protein ACRD3O_00125 [Terriglobia bacterium]
MPEMERYEKALLRIVEIVEDQKALLDYQQKKGLLTTEGVILLHNYRKFALVAAEALERPDIIARLLA